MNFVSSTLVFNETYGFSTVIHEFTHSYFGNDVTCVNWNHFWINEGLDVFMERKVWEIMLGDDDLTKRYYNEGNQGLLQDMFNYGMNDSYTSLFPNVGENDPEDSYSYVPYEKGSQFIYYIETLIGKDKMQFMLHQYLTNFSNLAIDQQQFKEFYERFLYNNFDETSAITIINETRWDDWIYGRGLPPITLNFTINKESVQPTKSPTASSSSADRGNSYVPELLLCLTLSSILLSVLSR